jgi:hypothetical protein
MFLSVLDDTGSFSHLMNEDVPDVVKDAIDAFDFFTYHYRTIDGHNVYALRATVDIKDYEWWRGMVMNSGPDDPLIQRVEADHIDYYPVQTMVRQKIFLDKGIGYRPDSPLLGPYGPPGKYVMLRVWLVYPFMVIKELPSTAPSDKSIWDAVLDGLTSIATEDQRLQYGPPDYTITMVPLLVCSRIKYSFVKDVLIGDHPLGNAPVFSRDEDDDISSVLHEHNFNDMARDLMDYWYVLPLSGLHFMVHQQSPRLILKYIPGTFRSTLPLYEEFFSPPQRFMVSGKSNELVKCLMYFPGGPIRLNGCEIKMPERITFECRKSDTLYMLVSAGLSMGLSVSSPNEEDVGHAIAEIIRYLNNYCNDTRGMIPIINNDPMEVSPSMVKVSY